MRKIFLLFASLFIFSLIGIASAEIQTLGTFKVNECTHLKQTCSNCTYSNITSLMYPNSIAALGNVPMTRNGREYNYTFCNNTQLGRYIVNGVSDVDGLPTVWGYDYRVTGNGKEEPSGIIIVLFSIIFIVIAGCMIYLLIYNIGHIARLDIDLIDLSYNLGSYFALFAVLLLGKYYLGNPVIDDWFTWMIGIGGFTNVIVPVGGFIASMVVASLRAKRVKF